GHKVLETGDGQEAVEVMRSGDRSRMVTAILVDIGLPRNSGVEAIAFFRLQYPSIPVVVLTGQRDCDLAITLMKMGVRDYVVKPVVKQDLLRVLAGAVQGDHTARSQCVA
ncbi:MAG: response regulator, partial [Nitrospira sp.]|nr:response regulator [Nitrospira sp.]